MGVLDELDTLARGREACRRRAWADAHEALSAADRAASLAAEDLERLAAASYLIGRDDDHLTVLDRAHHAHLEAGERVQAARCAFWAGFHLLLRGETGPATGWLARARRLVEGVDCAERGYLLLPVAERQLGAGEHGAAHATASDAVEIGERLGDDDLVACARHLQGRALLRQGRVHAGLALLDETMVAVSAGELSPIVTGLLYCSVIEACQESHALGRSREWTSALARWCDEQPQLVAFTATCLVRRAEVMQLHGAWPEALEEARRAGERETPPAAAFYQQAEMHRLTGEFTAAEKAYRNASRRGRDPQPGLALLRLAQGQADAADAAIRRALSATTDRLQRAKLLPAGLEVTLATRDLEAAREACRELEEVAERFDTGALGAMAAHARGALALAEGDPGAALASLRRAWASWQEIEAPYEAARVRVLMGRACRALGDEEGCRLELEAARAVFERLGAQPDLARLDSLGAGRATSGPAKLTPRELEVLRLVATGRTNKAIAAELSLSERTIDRHVSNILGKLHVASRTAATAYAYEHDLI